MELTKEEMWVYFISGLLREDGLLGEDESTSHFSTVLECIKPNTKQEAQKMIDKIKDAIEIQFPNASIEMHSINRIG